MSFGEPVPDATGELRLQLMQAQDQREAFRALGHRDVLAVIREALATDLSETCDKLRAEITRMEGENHRLRARAVVYIDREKMRAEMERLKAENERLRKAGDAMADAIKWLPQTISDHHQQAWNAAKEVQPSEEVLWVQLEDYEKLKVEVERLAGEVNRLYLKTELLVECGDEMANRAGQEWCPTWVVEDWNKAKEGKQS